MQKWKTILLDDSEGISLVLKQFLEMDCPQIDIVGMASNIQEAEMLIFKYHPDILFLDVHVNENTSFDLLENLYLLNKLNFEVIFITDGAQDDLFTKAINFSYLDNLSKPVDLRILKQLIDKITFHCIPGLPNERIGILLNLITNKEESQIQKVPFLTEKLQWLQVEEVEYLKSYNAGTICSIVNKTVPLFSSHSIDIYRKWLSNKSPFISVKGSFLVNMHKVQRFNSRKNVLHMQSGEHITVAFNCVNQVLNGLSAQKKSGILFPGIGIKNVLRKFFLN